MAVRTDQAPAAADAAASSGPPARTSGADAATRKRLAMSVVAISAVGIIAISGLTIGFAGSSNRADTSKLVFTAVLPLFGTWVGTVLAFYFAQGNLEAATNSTLALAGSRETATPVTKVMIPESDFATYDAGPADDFNAIKLS